MVTRPDETTSIRESQAELDVATFLHELVRSRPADVGLEKRLVENVVDGQEVSLPVCRMYLSLLSANSGDSLETEWYL